MGITIKEQIVKVFDKTGQVQMLGAEIARGGEGAVYALAARPSVPAGCRKILRASLGARSVVKLIGQI